MLSICFCLFICVLNDVSLEYFCVQSISSIIECVFVGRCDNCPSLEKQLQSSRSETAAAEKRCNQLQQVLNRHQLELEKELKYRRTTEASWKQESEQSEQLVRILPLSAFALILYFHPSFSFSNIFSLSSLDFLSLINLVFYYHPLPSSSALILYFHHSLLFSIFSPTLLFIFFL